LGQRGSTLSQVHLSLGLGLGKRTLLQVPTQQQGSRHDQCQKDQDPEEGHHKLILGLDDRKQKQTYREI